MCVQADPAPVACEGYDPLTGQYNKDVLPFSPTRPADPTVYHFTEVSGTTHDSPAAPASRHMAPLYCHAAACAVEQPQ